MQKTKPVLRLLLLLAFAFGGMHAGAQAKKDYCNARFGYCISYSPALLSPAPEAQNGDGRMFKDKDAKGRERMSVWGTGNWNFSNDGTPINLKQLYAIELKGGRFPKEGGRVVTYKTMGKTFFILSGTEGGEIFYLKVLQRDDAFCYAWLHYTAAEAAKYKPVAELIAQSFR